MKPGEGGVRGTVSFILEGEQVWHESRFERDDRRRERLREEGRPIIPEGVDPWEQLVAQIEPHRQLLVELRKAAKARPESYIHGDYTRSPFEAPMPSFASVRNLTHFLFADALIALQAGDSETALANAQCIQRLGNLNPGTYFLVNAMIEVVTTKGCEIPIYAIALREGILDDSELKRLIAMSTERHALADFEWSMHHEIAGGAEMMTRGFDADMFFLSTVVGQTWWGQFSEVMWKTLFKMMPEGWIYIMASRHVYYTSLILEPYEAKSRRLELDRTKQYRQVIDNMIREARFFNLLAAMAIPAFEKVTETTLTLQCQQDMLGIACALELYRRANSDLPTSLEELSPEFIAKLHDDPVSGEAYRYERVDEKNYRLWAVGMDGLDDGGNYDPEEKESNQADVVWLLSYGTS